MRRATATILISFVAVVVPSLRASADEAAKPPRNKNLEPLAFLLGEWAGTADNSEMLVSCRWSDGGNYLIRDFAVVGDHDSATATERIGWDSATKSLKSWTFDSQDGRSESTWKRDGDKWLVNTTEVMADGQTAKTSAVVSPAGAGQFEWQVKTCTIGSEKVAPRKVTFKRAKDKSAAGR